MINHINGKLVEKFPTHVVIECNGLGYHINISLFSYEHLPAGEQCKLLTTLIVREDAHLLYGFVSEAERNLFLLLTAVSGIGPNTARLILSAMGPAELVNAISREDDKLLTKIKGLGPKTAKLLILQLKDKVDKLASDGEIFAGKDNTARFEALSGLLVLGFDKKKAELAIDAALAKNPDFTVEELIKAAIKLLF